MDDRLRPVYHFAAPANFTGDPNGAIVWNGVYHLFYQHNPDGAYDNPKRMHWGHASSRDLVHWDHLPIALAPEPDGPDRLGCYSGGAVDWNGIPTLVYYGSPDGICIATSSDGLRTWSRHALNPVIKHPANTGAQWRCWDPFAWRGTDAWYLICGGKIAGDGDTAFLFRSCDFTNWQYLHLLYEPGSEMDCSVPDLFRLGGKHVLLFASHERGAQYYVGEWHGEHFVPERHGRMNFGGFTLESGTLAAPITLLDEDDRRIMFGWVTEGRSEAAQRASGWSGVVCVPRLLGLCDDGNLSIDPVPELGKLRGKRQRFDGVPIPTGSTVLLPNVCAISAEIDVRFDLSSANEIGISVCCSRDHSEHTDIVYSRAQRTLTLDPSVSSSSSEAVARSVQCAPLELRPDEPLELRIFVDRSIIEVFANSQQCVTQRVYPSDVEAGGVALFAQAGDVVARSIDVWQMRAI